MNPKKTNELINPDINNPDVNDLLNNENLQDEKFRDIEIDPARKKQMQPERPLSGGSATMGQLPTSAMQNLNNPQDNPDPGMDPVQHVKSMISSGYTPSLDLMKNTAALLKSGHEDWSNTWFAVLLQKLIRQSK